MPSLGIRTQGGEIEQDARSAEHDERDGGDAEEDGVDVEVLAEAAGHAAEGAVGGGAGQTAGSVFLGVHGMGLSREEVDDFETPLPGPRGQSGMARRG